MAKYYVSNGGSDSNNGMSKYTPFETIEKMSSVLESGDSAYLKCGDIFYGIIELPEQVYGSDIITVSSYGSGPQRVISGYKIITDGTKFTQESANIWKIDIADTNNYGGNTYTSDSNVGFLKVDGIIHGNKVISVDDMLTKFDFFSDNLGSLYVYSEENPLDGKSEMCVAINVKIVKLRNSVEICGLELIGAGGHGVSGVGSDVKISGNTIHEIGGSELIGFSTPNTRYGNGVEIWSDSRNVLVENNIIYDIYDVATTMQGDVLSFGWENVVFRGNKIYNCNQTFEIWASGTDPDFGFKKCFFINNICLNGGMSWSSDVRTDQTTKCHMLIYTVEVPIVDIVIKNNLFYMAEQYLYFTWWDSIPDGYKTSENFIFLNTDTPIYNRLSSTVSDYNVFVEDTGKEINSIFHNISSEDDIESLISNAFTTIGLSIAENNIAIEEIKELSSKICGLNKPIKHNKNNEISHLDGYLKSSGGYITKSSDIIGDFFAPMCDFNISDKYTRADITMFFMLCSDEEIPRKGSGILDVQVVPNSTDFPTGTSVSMSVFETTELSAGFEVDNFKVIITQESSDIIRGTLYFNVGKNSYHKLSFQPLCVYGGRNGLEFEFLNSKELISTLPSGNIFNPNENLGIYVKRPEVNSFAPNTIPTYIGEEYIDSANRKIYKAIDTSAVSDWVMIN